MAANDGSTHLGDFQAFEPEVLRKEYLLLCRRSKVVQQKVSMLDEENTELVGMIIRHYNELVGFEGKLETGDSALVAKYQSVRATVQELRAGNSSLDVLRQVLYDTALYYLMPEMLFATYNILCGVLQLRVGLHTMLVSNRAGMFLAVS